MSAHDVLAEFTRDVTELHVAGIVLALAALAGILYLAHRLGLDLAGEAFVATLRGAVQLSVVALVLFAVVASDQSLWIALVLLVMVVAAGWTATSRVQRRGLFPLATLTIAVVTGLLVVPLVYLGPFEARPLFLIPITGMVLGNAMNATALGLDRMDRELRVTLPVIEAKLALGAAEATATRAALRETSKTSLLPLLNTMKTTGLVHLPGTMTGMLIAGASPVAAAEMQFVIIVVLLIASFLSATAMALWMRRAFVGDLSAGRREQWRQQAEKVHQD